MLRVLRAFAWLRWRSFMNGIDGTGSRDTLARLSTATDTLAPVIVVLMTLPSAVALAALAGYAGWAMARESGRVAAFEAVRFLLAAGCGIALLSPLLFPSRERPNSVRLLLLPIHRRVLYAAHALSLLSHPVLLLAGALALALPLGLAMGGRPGAALVVATGGVALVAVLSGLLAVVTSAAQLLLRDRRRGEWIALLLFLLLPAIALLPAFAEGRRTGLREEVAERRAERTVTIERRVMRLVPSEPYIGAARAATTGRQGAALESLAWLAAAAALLHAAGFALFVRVLASGGSNRRTPAFSRSTWWRIPGLPPAVSALAMNHVRLVFRTPRGRFVLLSPMVVLLLVVGFSYGASDVRFAFLRLDSGLGVAVFTGVTALLGTVPLAMNQFAIDGAGLARTLLAPLDTRALLTGKALGNGLAAAIPATACTASAPLLFPAGDPHLWLCLPTAFLSVLLLSAPSAAALSALFPRVVDLSSISRGSNAHGVAGLLGALTIAGAAALTAVPVLVATRLLKNPALAPVFLLAWCALCAACCAMLVPPVAALFDRRRESLLMLRSS